MAEPIGEPFTVREMVTLSPYARERSDDSQVPDAHLTTPLGTTVSGSAIEDRPRIRWGTMLEFKELEHRGHSDRRRPGGAVPPRSAVRWLWVTAPAPTFAARSAAFEGPGS